MSAAAKAWIKTIFFDQKGMEVGKKGVFIAIFVLFLEPYPYP